MTPLALRPTDDAAAPERYAVPADARADHAFKSAIQRGRFISLETIAPLSDDPIVSLPALAS